MGATIHPLPPNKEHGTHSAQSQEHGKCSVNRSIADVQPEVVSELPLWRLVWHKNRNLVVGRWVTLSLRTLGWWPDLPCCISQCAQTCFSLEIPPILSILNWSFCRNHQLLQSLHFASLKLDSRCPLVTGEREQPTWQERLKWQHRQS